MTQEDKMRTDAPARDPFADAPTRNPYIGAAAPEAPAEDSQHQSPYAAYLGSPENRIGCTQPIPMRRGLFDGISVAQVIAASAAAATSMLLASRIGIAGSVIGAAVSSMVTVICSQLYRNALDASAEKLKEKQMLAASAHGGPRREDARGCAAPQTRGGAAGQGGDAAEGRVLTARIAPTKLQARAAAERSANKRKVALASAVIALAAVAATAGGIMLGTAGAGLGAKTEPIFQPSAQEPVAPEQPAAEPISDGNRPQGAVDTDADRDGADKAPETPPAATTGDEQGGSQGMSQNDPAASGGTGSDAASGGDGAAAAPGDSSSGAPSSDASPTSNRPAQSPSKGGGSAADASGAGADPSGA